MVYPFIDRDFWPNRVLNRDGVSSSFFLLFVLSMHGMKNEDSNQEEKSFFEKNSLSVCMFVVRFVVRAHS